MKRISILLFALAIAFSSSAQINIFKWLQLKNAGASDTAAVSGKFWYDANVNHFSFVENGVVKHFGTASALPPLSPGYIYVGNGSSIPTAQALSGDGTLSSAGSLTVTGLKTKAVPSLTAGFLKYTGSAWTFDASTYLTSFTETDPIVKAINGIVKSNGTTISAASAGTDYLAPFGSQTAKFFYAAPNGSSGTPGFRAVVASDIPTLNQNTTGSSATLTTPRTIAITGDLAYTSPSFDGSGNVTAAGTLATVNSNVGTFGSATKSVTATVNGKGLVTAISEQTLTPAVGSITGLAANIATWLATSTSANLAAALTDETGTGAAVFAGSPAFTGTPTLGTLGYSDTNVLFSFQGSANSYVQMILQNTNSGSAASTDLVISNNSGTASTFYGDLGMNSSGFTGSGSLNFANAVYLYSNSGDLVLGTNTNNAIHLLTNASTTDALSISGAGLFAFNMPTVSNTWVGTATATGNNQYFLQMNPVSTMRATVSDAFNSIIFKSQVNTAATTQNIGGVIADVDLHLTGAVNTFTPLISNTTAGCTNGTTTGFSGFTYTNQDGTGTSASGVTFDVTVAGNVITTIVKNATGSGYKIGDKFLFNGSSFGGSGSVYVEIVSLSNTLSTSSSDVKILTRAYIPTTAGVVTPINKWIDFQTLDNTGTAITRAYFGSYIDGGSTNTVAFGDQFGEVFKTNASVISFTRAISTSTATTFGAMTVKEITYGGSNQQTGTSTDFLTSPVPQRFLVNNQRFSALRTNNTITSGVPVTGTIVGGSGYTNGTYNGNFSPTGGTGTGLLFTQVVVSGAAVTSLQINAGTNGKNYKVGDVLTLANTSIGGTGSGFTWTISTVDFTGGIYASVYNDQTTTDNGYGGNIYATVYDKRTLTQNNTAGTPYVVTLEQNFASITGTPNIYGALIRTSSALSSFGLGATNPVSNVDTQSFGMKPTAVSTNITLDATYGTVYVDASGGNKTITLPSAAGATGRIYYVIKTDASANTVTISTTAAGNKVISAQYAGYGVNSNATSWYVVSSF